MKIFISADMEGVTGTTLWEECRQDHPTYAQYAKQMSNEVLAACEGAIAAGATEIVVRDAHNTGTNIDLSILPECVSVIRNWSGHPYSMVDGIDTTFDAAMFIGYHAPAGNSDNPLAHTMTGNAKAIKLNGEYASEFMLYSYAAALEGVPTVFVSGDDYLCKSAQQLHPNLKSVAVKKGNGASTISISQKKAVDEIRKTAKIALSQDLSTAKIKLPKSFVLEIEYKEHTYAKRKSFYPGIAQINSHTLQFKTSDYFEVLRVVAFIL
ncbi:M55 family metallopeptidase [Fusibacter bizertensis]|uniref:M55 family metallopeptidase n=1 Tax=Fusibacter bizertensis TaxID=1488331 RepID=A0ABT6NH58_9FIRM|nr:M55 family metallopeptidase [Fusibacter bizertensis]MDH8679678.1 M55 family metallopeptidase [Fusibacter bizertensis]